MKNANKEGNNDIDEYNNENEQKLQTRRFHVKDIIFRFYNAPIF